MVRPYGPLRGRDEALRAALAVVRRTADHRANGVVLISGEPGIGKTSLLSEIARHAAHSHMRIARSKCDEIEQAFPCAPILGLLRAGRDPLIRSEDFRELGAMTANPLALVDRIAEHLHQLTASARLLIAVDDVQWADPISRYALRTLIPRLAGRPVAWVLATRQSDGGVNISAADLVDVEHIKLGPLTPSAVREMACDRMMHEVTDEEMKLLTAAGGNPFLAAQLIDGLMRDSGVRRSGEVPAEFRAAVRHRLSRMAPAARRVIDTLAVDGRPFHVDVLCQLSDVRLGPEAEDAVDAVIVSGLVASIRSDLEFTHDLVRQTVYDAVAPDRRLYSHSRFADYFLHSGQDPAAAAAHARVAVTLGDESSARVMITAAELLVESNAAYSAELAREAFAALRPAHRGWEELGERAVAVLAAAQRANDTISAVDRLLATVDDADRVSRIETHAVKALWHNGCFAEIIRRSDRTLGIAEGRPDLLARFGAAQALANTKLIGADAAGEQAEMALAAARMAGDLEALAFGLQAAGEAAHGQRRHLLALKRFRELRAVTEVPYLAEEIMQLQLLDRYDDAQLLLDGAREDSRHSPGAMVPSLMFAQAKQHYNLGQLADADRVASSVVELGQLIGTKVQVVEATLVRVFVSLLRGEVSVARRRVQYAMDVLGERDGLRHPGVLFSQGWLSVIRGDVEQGLTRWTLMLDTPSESRSYSAWWPCWMPVLLKFGIIGGADDLVQSVLDSAKEAADRNPEVATLNGVAVNLRGLADNDLGAVAESVEILRHSPRCVLRALSAESYGKLLLDGGERQKGLEQLDRAWDEYHYMGATARRAAVQKLMRGAGARRPKWSSSSTDAADKPLTEAERRVVYLIVDGHTDKMAAKALGISVNTVGTHLRSAYVKLGVQSRVQLAKALRERGELD
jgi:DNA-binding CsgD family transcriptional regulator